MQFTSIYDVFDDLCNGKIVIVVDDENRENEGDLLMLADYVTERSLNFMLTFARGSLCLAIHDDIARRLNLHLQPRRNTNDNGAALTLSIDSVKCNGGVSVSDRVRTIRTVIDQSSAPNDLRIPGHMYPAIAVREGLMLRRGHTEAAIACAEICDKIISKQTKYSFGQISIARAGLLCEVLDSDGEMANMEYLREFAMVHDLKIGKVDDIAKVVLGSFV